MFTIKAPATIPATLTIEGQGREQKLNLVYRSMPRTDYQAKIEQLQKGETSVDKVLLELVESWEADVPFDAAGIALAQQEQPGLVLAILFGYSEANSVGRKGN
ncbi:phage tail assembly chaperone [Luteibacter sp. PPL552]